MIGAVSYLATVALVGCGGLSSESQLPEVRPDVAATSYFAGGRPPAAQSLLYVSNVNNDTVTEYAFPSGKFTRTLRSSKWPEGECTDSSGDVWVADDGSSRLVEYAHAGTKPIATLQDPGNYPYGCSVDSKSGDLAVTNIASTYGFPVGSLTIYAGAKGPPKAYFASKLYRYYFCAYDSSGSLFVDGIDRSNSFELAELPHGKSNLTSISLNQSIGSPGNVVWDGKHIAVGDGSDGTIYQISVSGSQGTVVSTTSLSKGGNAAQFFVDGREAVAGVTGSTNKFGLWKYPAGGNPTSIFKLARVDGPYAVAVSK
jgi:hypothetical protein